MATATPTGGGAILLDRLRIFVLDAIVSFSEADISWDAPTTGGIPDNYRVQVQIAGGDWSSLVINSTTTNLFFSLTGLSQNTEYDVRVRAENGDGNSSWVQSLEMFLTYPAPPLDFRLTPATLR